MTMDLALSERQERLKSAAREFLDKECPKSYVREMEADEKGYSPQVWKKIAGLGWLGLPFPEEYGGSDGSFLDLALLLEEMGRACLPGPFFSTTVLSGLLLLGAANRGCKAELLPKIASGDLIVTLALTEPSNSYKPSGVGLRASPEGLDFVLSGTKLFVSDAHIADYVICVARTKDAATKGDGITLFLVDTRSAGLSTILLNTIGGDKQCEVIFDKVKVSQDSIIGELDRGWPLIERILERAALGKCAEMVGGGQQVIEMAVSHAKERQQFGHPIGSFQAIQFHCANMLIDVDISRYLTYEAAWKIDEGLSHSMEVAIAKAGVGDAYHRVVALGHQVIGGVGYKEDHDMHLYFNRAKAAELLFGGADFYREKIAQELGL
jgi:alkylation response protein AidB-like acyl-CoA dehydrogenase